ncbi:uncharacterized protein LOC125227451 isoform X1 [Leguminivora glycinivorella]|uniref:uncharacterized protein LOC125227451 isoform X1 n=1 Tax=Leguminivora glycinivorella TaxID=1035111 RepID=UPI00200C2ACE|nr:uncharacterized protein LOC125227451 isoform X1 [Leguminivora glycinivorella]
MRLLALLCSIGCAGAELMPGCYSTSCVTRDYTHTGGWLVKDYLVDGALMSVATKPGDYAVRWSCHGLNPIDEPAPRVYTSYIAYEVELIDCDIPQTVSYMDLIKKLNITSKYTKSLTISTTMRPRNSKWFSTDDLEKIKNKHQVGSNNWLAAAAANLPKNFLDNLTLRGIPMTIDQFISIQKLKSLTLVDTGLEKMMNLKDFSNLKRLELREPYLLNAENLNATNFEELVLHSPDAGLTAMPQLRNATFIEVYMMGRLFGNCTNLNHLALIDGTLSVLPDHWLVGCSALISLKITQLRNLNKVPGDLLDDTTVLRYLDLSHNSLEALPEGLLDNTRSLEHLNVGDNNLKTLPENLPISLKRVEACGNDQRPLTYKTLSTLEHWACIKIMSQL